MKKSHLFIFIPVLFLAFSCGAVRRTQQGNTSGMSHHLAYLASDDLQGRFPGTRGDSLSGDYLAEQFTQMGMVPMQQEFSFLKGVKRGTGNNLMINGKSADNRHFTPFSFSKDTLITAGVVFGGYGMSVKADSFVWNDYEGLDVKGKWVMVLRESPTIPEYEQYFAMGSDDRDKAMLASDKGAAGIILVSGYAAGADDKLVEVKAYSASVDIPALHITRTLADTLLKGTGFTLADAESAMQASRQSKKFDTRAMVTARTHIEKVTGKTRNWYAIMEGSDPALQSEYLVIGAHYDHLGMGGAGSSSRRPDTIAVHNGADDNASGVAAMLELGTRLRQSGHVKRSVILIAFGGEEMGLLGSKHFVKNPVIGLSQITAMINLDMVGRLDTVRGLQIGGTGTSVEADSLVALANRPSGIKLRVSPDGGGPSDHASFYAKDIPVFFVTTGAHTDYHTPFDDAGRINYEGMHTVTDFVFRLAAEIANMPEKLSYREAGPKEGSTRSHRFKVSLGFMPDFSATDVEGVRVDLVSKGKAAERGGIRNGDIITAIDGLAVKNIYDYMYRLSKLTANQRISVEVLRDGKKEVFIIQLQ